MCDICSRSNNYLLLWHKLWSKSDEVAGHVHTQLLKFTEKRRLLLILYLLHLNCHINLENVQHVTILNWPTSNSQSDYLRKTVKMKQQCSGFSNVAH